MGYFLLGVFLQLIYLLLFGLKSFLQLLDLNENILSDLLILSVVLVYLSGHRQLLPLKHRYSLSQLTILPLQLVDQLMIGTLTSHYYLDLLLQL